MLGLTVNSTPGTVDSAVLVAAEHDEVRVSGVGVLPKCVGASVGGGGVGSEWEWEPWRTHLSGAKTDR